MINTSQNSRQAFSERLRQSLSNRSIPISPTALAKGFNTQFDGKAITVQTASNWLYAISFPSQDKLEVLADWLSVDIHWLRFGDDNYTAQIKQFSDEQIELLHEFSLLSPDNQSLFLNLIKALNKKQSL